MQNVAGEQVDTEYNNMGIKKNVPLDLNPVSQKIIYNSARRPTQGGSLLPGQTISDLTFVSGYSQRRIRITMNPADNPIQDPGSIAIINEEGEIIWSTGDETFFSIEYIAPAEDQDVSAITAFDAFPHTANLVNLTIGNPGASGDVIEATNQGSGNGLKMETNGGWPLALTDDDPLGGVFQRIAIINFGQAVIVISDGTDPNGVLTAPIGSLCMNSTPTGQLSYNTDGSDTWVAL